jgi:hypothetical protein
LRPWSHTGVPEDPRRSPPSPCFQSHRCNPSEATHSLRGAFAFGTSRCRGHHGAKDRPHGQVHEVCKHTTSG